jgi:hypothetical protein
VIWHEELRCELRISRRVVVPLAGRVLAAVVGRTYRLEDLVDDVVTDTEACAGHDCAAESPAEEPL